jgi:hypothetical protein
MAHGRCRGKNHLPGLTKDRAKKNTQKNFDIAPCMPDTKPALARPCPPPTKQAGHAHFPAQTQPTGVKQVHPSMNPQMRHKRSYGGRHAGVTAMNIGNNNVG